MKTLVMIATGLTLAIGLYLIVLSMLSRKPAELGIKAGQLLPCPETPNCVCSEYSGVSAYVRPMSFSVSSEVAWNKARLAVLGAGGKILTEQLGYLHVRFVTPIFLFIDDVELRLDEGGRVIHIRSASRVGRSDLGLNRKRVARIRELFEKEE
ncbi:MAG: DUF1499 domain-containing protein [Gammaproteobacteria bacterium]|nr:DUF1499 domain-containing protein [Gammaproteobacteria bacterium]